MKRIPGIKAVFVGTRAIALSDADARDLLRRIERKARPVKPGREKG